MEGPIHRDTARMGCIGGTAGIEGAGRATFLEREPAAKGDGRRESARRPPVVAAPPAVATPAAIATAAPATAVAASPPAVTPAAAPAAAIPAAAPAVASAAAAAPAPLL